MVEKDFTGRGRVAVLRTSPERVLEDYARLMHLAEYERFLPKDEEMIIKLNLSWTKYFPACSSEPWQVEGVVKTLLDDGYRREKLYPVENKTVVTNPRQGAINNKWMPVLEKHGLPFIALPEVEWVKYEFKGLLKLDQIFPEGIEIPRLFIGKNIIHLPTVKCVDPKTEIVLEDGSLVEIADLMEEKLERGSIPLLDADGDLSVAAKQPLFSLASNGGVVVKDAQLFWRTPLNGHKIWLVRTKTGKEVRVSSEHPFLTPQGWRRASELQAGDRIAIPRRIKVEGESQPLPRLTSPNCQRNVKLTVPEKSSPEFCRWMGYLLAEGHVDRKNGFHFVNSDPRIREDYRELTNRLFNIGAATKGIRVVFRNAQLREFIQKLGLPVPLHAGNKLVPRPLFRCPDEEIASLLQGYLDGDGDIRKNSGERNNSYSLHVTTKSERLAKDVQYLFSRLGVISFRSAGWCKISRKNPKRRLYHTNSVYGYDLAILAKQIRLLSEHKQRRLANSSEAQGLTSWDTIPIPPDLFRRVREGLGLPRKALARWPGTVKAFENNYGPTPSRAYAERYVDVLDKHDTAGQFEAEIAYMRFLLNEDIAWDHVIEIREELPQCGYFYDLSVEEAHNFVGDGVILSNTHGHSIMTLSIKNAFGGLLKEVRHYAHEFIHEVLVDLLTMQYQLHPGIFAVADGTVCGDGAGPRTMRPFIGNYILASADQVAIDAIAAKMMGFDPLQIPYLRMAAEMGYGVADPREIEVIGEYISEVNFGFRSERSFVIWGDQMIRKGPLRPLKRLLLHSPLVIWAPLASNVYHDLLWYPTVGQRRIKEFMRTEWGKLFESY